MKNFSRSTILLALASCPFVSFSQGTIQFDLMERTRVIRNEMFSDTSVILRLSTVSSNDTFWYDNGRLRGARLKDGSFFIFGSRGGGVTSGSSGVLRSPDLASPLTDSGVKQRALEFLQSIGTQHLDPVPLPELRTNGTRLTVRFRLSFLGIGTIYDRSVTIDRSNGDIVHFAFGTAFSPCTTSPISLTSRDVARQAVTTAIETEFGEGWSVNGSSDVRWHTFPSPTALAGHTEFSRSWATTSARMNAATFKAIPCYGFSCFHVERPMQAILAWVDARDSSVLLLTLAERR